VRVASTEEAPIASQIFPTGVQNEEVKVRNLVLKMTNRIREVK